MSVSNPEELARQGETIYRDQLKDKLESSHPDAFVAIEPLSGDFFLGSTLSEALGAARNARPDSLSHVVRVGHRAAIQFGSAS